MTETEEASNRATQAWDDHAYRVLSAAAVVIVASATIVYRLLEDWSWVDSLYFSVVAVTTVGFGDLTPSSDASKLFTVAYILTGVSIFGLYLNQRTRRRSARKRAKGEET